MSLSKKNLDKLNNFKKNKNLNKYYYIVDDIEVVDANTGDYVLFNRGDDRLTLTTCHPRYSARERLVVSGILTKIESGN